MKNSLIIALFTFFFTGNAQTSHWEAIILANQTFKYFVSGGEPVNTWYTESFNDSSWKQGEGGFGYGDNDDGTIISATTSVYIRKSFQVNDISKLNSILLDVDYDDGYIAYLNGKEVARSSNVTAQYPTYNTTLSAGHEAGVPERTKIDISDIHTGANILAVHVINQSASSSDLSSNIYLHALITGNDTLYYKPASFFIAPMYLQESNLPIIKINTEGQNIVNDPKITAHMQAVQGTPGTINSADGPFNAYDGWIGIELRGESTLTRDKKSYRIETRTSTGEKNNVALMGMPSENDWILYGPYVDKSLIRNEMAFHICDVLGQYASRRQYCELIINDEYQGLYILEEKIKVDDNRVNIAKLKPEDISGDELTGGYIFRSDKSTGYTYFYSGVSYQGTQANLLQYYDPGQDELLAVQKAYLKNYITGFEKNLVSNGYKDPGTGYNNYINVSSFIDYLIASEMILEVDRFRFSTYFYKEKDSNGGKIYAGPMWDNNYGFGITDSYTYLLNDDVWTHQDMNGRIYWWRRMMEDPYFKNLFFTRWMLMREGGLSDESLGNHIDSIANLVMEAQVRNFTRWPIMGIYVYPNRFVGQNYGEEVEYIKNWMNRRNAWIDQNITGNIISPELILEIPSDYEMMDTFNINLTLKDDYFNRTVFKNKHFKLNNEGDFFKKDTIISTGANTATIKLANLLPGTTLPNGFFVTANGKVVNTSIDISSNALNTSLKSVTETDNLAIAYFRDNKLCLQCNQPLRIGNEIFVYDMIGRLLTNQRFEAAFRNYFDISDKYRMLLIKIKVDDIWRTIKLSPKE